MRPTSFHAVLLLICALTLAPMVPAFAQAAIAAQSGSQACEPPHAAAADTHIHHTQADEPANADSDCAQHDVCGGACCSQCAHCFVVPTAMSSAGPAAVSVYAAARVRDRSLLTPDLLERPPRLFA
jgi:hypothetical protein